MQGLKLSFVTVLLMTLFAACSSIKNNTTDVDVDNIEAKSATADVAAISPSLKQTSWKFKELIVDGKPVAINKDYRLTFADKDFGLKLDVNNCGGTFKTENNQLIIDGTSMFCTEMCCDSENAKILQKQLASNVLYTVEEEDKVLIMTNKNSKMMWVSNMNIDKSIAGKRWKINSYVTEGKAIPFEKNYYISFVDGRVVLQLDVNTCNTNYSVFNPNKIQLNPMGCSRRCCDSKEGMALLEQFKEVIEINLLRGVLTIKGADKTMSCTEVVVED